MSQVSCTADVANEPSGPQTCLDPLPAACRCPPCCHEVVACQAFLLRLAHHRPDRRRAVFRCGRILRSESFSSGEPRMSGSRRCRSMTLIAVLAGAAPGCGGGDPTDPNPD